MNEAGTLAAGLENPSGDPQEYFHDKHSGGIFTLFRSPFLPYRALGSLGLGHVDLVTVFTGSC